MREEAVFMHTKDYGFTLIELLIVVAIIGILAAIAIPNFLQAQTRAKVTRVRNDLRVVATVAEIYYVDHNEYPPSPVIGSQFIGTQNSAYSFLPNCVTTPIAYMRNKDLVDIFSEDIFDEDHSRVFWQNCMYLHVNYNTGGWNDPDFSNIYFPAYGYFKTGSIGPNHDYNGGQNVYDPTNGTISDGDLYRTQKQPLGSID